jgi:hypothetical protein
MLGSVGTWRRRELLLCNLVIDACFIVVLRESDVQAQKLLNFTHLLASLHPTKVMQCNGHAKIERS